MRCPSALQVVGAADLAGLWEHGGWWRVLSTGFVHGSLLHLALNMWSLWAIGPWASRAWGHVGALACFLVSSVGGVLASIGWAEAPVVVGASAGIMGLAGGLWVSRGWGSEAVRQRVEPVSTRGLGTTLALMIGLGFVVPMIAQAGHVGGVVIGLLMGAAMSGSFRPGLRPALWTAAVLIVTGFGWAAAGPQWRTNYYAFRGYALLDEGNEEDALPLLRAALEKQGDDPDLQNGVAYALAEAGTALSEAEDLVDKALEVDPENADYLDTKGWILCRRGVVEEGLEWVRRAADASGRSVPEIEEHLESCVAVRVFHVER